VRLCSSNKDKELVDENPINDVDLSCSGLPAQKALGVYWDSTTDCMMVKVGLKQRSCTCRGLMSRIAQTYGLMGLIQSFLLPARQLLQETCKRSLKWDDDLANVLELGTCWRFTQSDKEILGFELHTFSDASISGYGIRVRYCDGSVKCCFLLGKSRVAPIKPVSVSRHKLSAAVLAAKMTNFVKCELDIRFSKVVLWTDSTVVLRYLHSNSIRFVHLLPIV